MSASPELVFFLPSMTGGGAERVFLNLAIELKRTGHSVAIGLAHQRGELLKAATKELEVFSIDRPSTFKTILGLTRELRSRRPDVVVSALPHTNVMAILANLLAGRPAKVIATEHSSSSDWSKFTDFQARLFPVILPLVYRLAHRVIAVSHGVARDLSRALWMRPGEIEVIYNPVLTADFDQRSSAAAPLLDELLRPGERLILAVGRLEPPKDHECLIHAFAEICRSTSTRLVILGEGSLRPKLVKLISDLGLEQRVHLPGFQPNPLPWIKRAGVLALSSFTEGLPTVLIEALALGTPVVSTDCPFGPREIFGIAGHGKLVPIGDPNAMAGALLESLRSAPPKVSMEVRRTFSVDKVRDQYLKACGLLSAKAQAA